MSLVSRIIPSKLHRKIEKAIGIEKNCLKEQVAQLRKLGHKDAEILLEAKGALEWLSVHDPKGNFVVAFQVYISCLKNENPAS